MGMVFSGLVAAGCSTAATIRTMDGEKYEVHIKRSDDDYVYAVPVGGKEERAFERADISEIDHPGNDHAIAGTIVTALMMIPLVNVIQCTGQSCDEWRILVGGMTAVPVVWAAWGWIVWGRSRAAASSSGPAPLPVEARAEPAGGSPRAYIINLFEWSW
jgi:hypothetical protein